MTLVATITILQPLQRLVLATAVGRDVENVGVQMILLLQQQLQQQTQA